MHSSSYSTLRSVRQRASERSRCPSRKMADIAVPPMSFPRLVPIFAALLLSGVLAGSARGQAFPVDAPEHQALTLASEALGDPNFTLRQDYWKGLVTPSAGRAVRLQFFKRNLYRLYFGVSPTELPKGAKLHLHIFDSKNKEVATAAAEPGTAAVTLAFENTLRTGVYLILMRVELPPGPLAGEEMKAVLFYGWK